MNGKGRRLRRAGLRDGWGIAVIVRRVEVRFCVGSGGLPSRRPGCRGQQTHRKIARRQGRPPCDLPARPLGCPRQGDGMGDHPPARSVAGGQAVAELLVRPLVRSPVRPFARPSVRSSVRRNRADARERADEWTRTSGRTSGGRMNAPRTSGRTANRGRADERTSGRARTSGPRVVRACPVPMEGGPAAVRPVAEPGREDAREGWQQRRGRPRRTRCRDGGGATRPRAAGHAAGAPG